jgi:hypothetical protein
LLLRWRGLSNGLSNLDNCLILSNLCITKIQMTIVKWNLTMECGCSNSVISIMKATCTNVGWKYLVVWYRMKIFSIIKFIRSDGNILIKHWHNNSVISIMKATCTNVTNHYICQDVQHHHHSTITINQGSIEFNTL